MGNEVDHLFPAMFPIFFLALWVAVSTALGFMSGWFALQRAYPRGDEPPLLTLRWRSGSMGLGVGMSGILTLSACRSGLRVGMFRLFGPFERPFLVPWHEISAAPAASLFMPRIRLHFGRPPTGSLTIDARTWQRLAAAVPDAPAAGLAPVSRARAGRGFLLQWLAASAFMGWFFYVASRLDAPRQGIPAAICFGFPAIVVGLGQAIRFLREES